MTKKNETILCDRCGSPAELVPSIEGDKKAWVCHHCKHFIGYQPEVWSRTVGYLRPVQQWNPGKRQEFKDRTPFKIPKEEGDEKK